MAITASLVSLCHQNSGIRTIKASPLLITVAVCPEKEGNYKQKQMVEQNYL
jgi:hypothetical protein